MSDILSVKDWQRATRVAVGGGPGSPEAHRRLYAHDAALREAGRLDWERARDLAAALLRVKRERDEWRNRAAELADPAAAMSHWKDAAEKRSTENARFRAALEQITVEYWNTGYAADRMRNIAQDALADRCPRCDSDDPECRNEARPETWPCSHPWHRPFNATAPQRLRGPLIEWSAMKEDLMPCPTCGSTDRAICRLGGAKVGHPFASASCCPDPWHKGAE